MKSNWIGATIQCMRYILVSVTLGAYCLRRCVAVHTVIRLNTGFGQSVAQFSSHYTLPDDIAGGVWDRALIKMSPRGIRRGYLPAASSTSPRTEKLMRKWQVLPRRLRISPGDQVLAPRNSNHRGAHLTFPQPAPTTEVSTPPFLSDIVHVTLVTPLIRRGRCTRLSRRICPSTPTTIADSYTNSNHRRQCDRRCYCRPLHVFATCTTPTRARVF